MPNVDETEINVPFPDASAPRNLCLSVGACRLVVRPGADPAWVSGSYRYPSGTIPAKIEHKSGEVRISQEWKGNWWGPWSGEPAPRFDLRLGQMQPYALTLEVGASDSNFDLGGLPLTQLVIKHGAGKGSFDFSAPNPEVMTTLGIQAGAAGLEMRNLVNANFVEMNVEGGAAAYHFDFGGRLQHEAHCDISAGMAGVDLTIPAATPARIAVDSIMAGVDLGDGFLKKEGAFWNEPGAAGKTPLLKIRVKITMGGLKLRLA